MFPVGEGIGLRAANRVKIRINIMPFLGIWKSSKEKLTTIWKA